MLVRIFVASAYLFIFISMILALRLQLKRERLIAATNIEFKVGDCIQDKSFRERWEPQPLIEKIVEVGERSYRTISYIDGAWSPERLLLLSPRKGNEHFYNIVTCPN